MHSLAREALQTYLHSYKYSRKEPGIDLLHDSYQDEQQRKLQEFAAASEAVELAKIEQAAFAVQAKRDYDGSVDERAPIKGLTVSFKKNDFIHVHTKFNKFWWIGRLVKSHSPIGFVPTAHRLANYMLNDDDELQDKQTHKSKKHAQVQQKSAWEPSCPYLVVPISRPIVLLGPTNQQSRLTQLLHLALRQEILKHFGPKMKHLRTNIGSGERSTRQWLKGAKVDKSSEESSEVELIMRLTARRKLLLIESPNIHTPNDVQHLPLAPIFILIRISDNKILCRLLRQTGTTRTAAELEVANVLKSMNNERFDIVIEENGLKEATWRIISFLEKYQHSLSYQEE